MWRQAEHNWFYFSTLWNGFLKGFEKFSCVTPEFHANTLTNMAKLLFEYHKNSKQR